MEDLETIQETAKKPQNLHGIWKSKFPEDLDVEAEIREIRDEWKKEFEEIFEFESENKE